MQRYLSVVTPEILDCAGSSVSTGNASTVAEQGTNWLICKGGRAWTEYRLSNVTGG